MADTHCLQYERSVWERRMPWFSLFTQRAELWQSTPCLFVLYHSLKWGHIVWLTQSIDYNTMYSELNREYLNTFQQLGAVITSFGYIYHGNVRGGQKLNLTTEFNAGGASVVLDMSRSGLLHFKDVNESILDRVYSAPRLIAHMSAELDINSLLALSAAPLLRECLWRRGGGERGLTAWRKRKRSRHEMNNIMYVFMLPSQRNGDMVYDSCAKYIITCALYNTLPSKSISVFYNTGYWCAVFTPVILRQGGMA